MKIFEVFLKNQKCLKNSEYSIKKLHKNEDGFCAVAKLWVQNLAKFGKMGRNFFMEKMKFEKEASARIRINKLLEHSGWSFEKNIQLESSVSFENLGNDFENAQTKDGRIGFADYILLDEKNFPLCILEAKKQSIAPLSAKEQARDYAKGKNCRFVILSNGISHYLWDLEHSNPEIITEFPTQSSLQHRAKYKENREDLVSEKISDAYLAPKKILREYQIEAIEALQDSAKKGKKRFLFEMATGTGKTTTAAAICKLFLRTGNASRILFLVDRIELEDQAVKAFQEIFAGEYFVGKIKGNNWQHCKIVVSTIQTLLAGNRYRELFSPIDFELVISDEAHRSLGGNSRAVFEYFLGYKLGLTATPKDFLKGVDEKNLETKNPKALEQRNLKDTYKTFGCEDGNPTYRYDLKKGVDDDFLINPFVVDARTEITTELLSKEGYSVEVENEEGETEEKIFGAKHFERKFFNEDTNRVFCETILNQGLCDPLTKEFGKTLVFCVSQAHASKITNTLNELAMHKWNGKYSSDFAVQVTSTVMESQKFTNDFTNNRLLGKSKFDEENFPDYGTSKARVCVTVGMMTTGYDCPDLLNIVLLRPIFSPSDFVQMKGRGTRKNVFEYQETGEKAKKEKFLLLDFFGNCEYFEQEFDYDKKINLQISPDKQKETDDKVVDTTKKTGEFDADTMDKISKEIIIHIGKEGMRIDRDLYKETYEQFEQVLQKSETIQKIQETEGIEGVENFVKTEIFNTPSEYWNASKIRNSYEKRFGTKRKISLTEMILKALGFQNIFKSREERIEEEYQKFIDIERPIFSAENVEKTQLIKSFFEIYLSDKNFREIIDTKRFGELAVYPSFGIDDFRKLNGMAVEISHYAQEYLHKEMAEFSFA